MNVLVVIVAPLIGVSPRYHVYVKDPKPSSSANVFDAAVNTAPCVGVPLIVTLPVGSLFPSASTVSCHIHVTVVFTSGLIFTSKLYTTFDTFVTVVTTS